MGERELQFFPDKTIGPILAKFDYFTNSGTRAAQITTNFKGLESLRIYYNGRSTFANAENYSNIEIIAKYVQNNFASIIKTKHGNGTIFLSGVHFEVNPIFLDKTDPFLEKIQTILLEDNTKREKFVLKLLGEVLPESDYETCDNLEILSQ